MPEERLGLGAERMKSWAWGGHGMRKGTSMQWGMVCMR